MSRRRWLLCLVFAGIGTGIGTWWFWPRTAITVGNFAKIQKGATLAEVETILGGPSRNEGDLAIKPDLPDNTPVNEVVEAEQFFAETYPPPPGASVWRSHKALGRVYFDEKGRVESTQCIPLREVERVTVWDHLRYRIDVLLHGERK